MGFTTTIQRKVGPKNPLKRPVEPGTAPNQSIMGADSGSDLATNAGDPRFRCSAYEPGGSPQLLAGDLTDVGRGYATIHYFFGVFDGATGTGSKAVMAQSIMEDGASDNGKAFANPPAPAGRRIELIAADPDDNMGLHGMRCQIGLPLPDTVGQETADFGTFLGNENASDMVGYGGSLLVLPITDEGGAFSQASPTIDDHGGGGILGNFNTDVFSGGYAGGKVLYSNTASDLAGEDTHYMNPGIQIPSSRRGENWLVMQGHFVEKRGSFPTASARVLRWSNELNGEEFTNVRTDTTTGGSTKSGRGYQIHMPLNNFWHLYSWQFRVMPLPTGRDLTGSYTTNIWDHTTNTGTQSEFDGTGFRIYRPLAFNQFESSESRVAVLSDSDTWADSDFEVTVEANGTTPFWLGLSTSLHQFEGQTRFRITRDGTPITPEGTDYPTWGQTNQVSFIGGTNGVGDTDNETLPFTLLWVDTPSAGPTTYKVQYRRNNGFTGAHNAIWNSRDDGSDGYIGTFFAAELSFPTRQPY